MILAAADDPCEMSGSLSDRCLRDGLRRISRVAQAEVGRRRPAGGGGGAAAASIARMRGFEDVRPSAGPTSPPGRERERESESQGQQRLRGWCSVETYGDIQERAVRKLRNSGQTAPQNLHIWQASCVPDVSAGCAQYLCVCRSWAWRRNEPLLHLSNYQPSWQILPPVVLGGKDGEDGLDRFVNSRPRC